LEVKLKSRYTAIGFVLAMVLSLMAVLPAMAGNLSIGSLDLKVQGGADSGSGYLNLTQDTRLGTTLYVGNSNAAYNKVVVQINHVAANTDTATENTVTVTVTNSTTNSKIAGNVTLTESGISTGLFNGSFLVKSTPTSADIGASSGNIVRVAYAGTGDVVNLTVDGTKPVIAVTGPVDDSVTRATTIDFGASITDSGSGMRTDAATGPNAAGPGAGSADADTDTITAAEPRTLSTGKSVDIAIRRIAGSDPSTVFTTKTGDFSETAVWAVATNGFSFVSTRLLTAAEHRWNVQARDRAGNEAITDGLLTTVGSHPLKLTIDSTAPAMGLVETGIGWNATTKKETANARNSLKISFTAAGAAPVGDDPTDAGFNGDYIDATTVDVSDFVISTSATDATALAISSVTHPNLKKSTTSSFPSIDTRHIVYVTLSNDMASNAKPKVSLVGALKDQAGNATGVADKTAVDKVAPKLTVTITGAAGTRAVSRGNAAGKEIVVRVVSDEPVSGTPTIDFTTFKFDATNGLLEVLATTAVTPTAVSGLTQTWETKQLNTVAGSANGLVGVFVRATDINSVAGSSGTGGVAASGAAVNLTVDLTTANLFEFDNSLAAATMTLTPATTGSKTESTNAFVRIDFTESAEYSLFTTTGDPATAVPVDKFECGKATSTAVTTCVADGAGTVGSSPTKVEIDSQNTVTLSSITLDGVDVSSSVGTVDSDSFVLATSGLALGDHVVKFNGIDIVGNTYTTSQSYTFTVVARSEYSVALSPGWNLISLPGDPADTAIGSVLPSTHPATTVLAYDPSDANGPWLSAVKSSGGTWSGTLTSITSSRAYWVETGAFTPIKTLIPERSRAAELPTIAVTAGWNLVPVVDLQITKGSTEAVLQARTGGLDPDLYLASVTWTVAYGFSTQANQWRKITPSATVDNVGQGKGYWLWVTKDGTLVP
jgi:hypothetical protein